MNYYKEKVAKLARQYIGLSHYLHTHRWI
uniref:Uncharacterized protein n=1 Tax=Arundo donax TaxID=35708 RepID=A0A0A9TS63_ARUDO